ncbi:uncharacterized protein LOC109830494 isoform X1 [Asparagus officinalis]|uniref:uncharacterized protein LOC109830494 isoform X1 n=1 Tax=Asparagus officinalis TaxID=4686 RepID=UPI00098E085B|nr:uncharacterized protein LOC109830494 isoform X1 [Asparagus officinalis]
MGSHDKHVYIYDVIMRGTLTYNARNTRCSNCSFNTSDFSGLWLNVTRFVSQLSAVPLVALSGFGLYELGFLSVAKCIEIELPHIILLIIFSQVTGNQVAKITFHNAVIRVCSWHPYYHMLVSYSWDCQIARWQF